MSKKPAVRLGIGIALIGLYVARCGHDRNVDKYIESAVLKPDEASKVIIERAKGKITVVTPDGKITKIVNNRPVAIVTGKDGKVKIVTRKWGTEFRPVIGLSYGDKTRAHVGAALFYVGRLDLNVSLAPNMNGRDLRAVGSVSYYVRSNTSVFVGVDQRQTMHAGVFVRL